MVVAIKLDHRDLAQLAFADDAVLGLHQVRRAAALGVDLDHPLVLARSREHGLPFDHVHADGLLAPHIRAGLHGGDGGERMPVVGSLDHDDVEIFFREHLAVIGVSARLLLGCLSLGDHAGGFGKHLAVHIAHGDDFDGRDLDHAKKVGFAIPSGSDDANAERLLLRVACGS